MGHFVRKVHDDETGAKAIKLTNTLPYCFVMCVSMKIRKILVVSQGNFFCRHGCHTQDLLNYRMTNKVEEKVQTNILECVMVPGKAMAQPE